MTIPSGSRTSAAPAGWCAGWARGVFVLIAAAAAAVVAFATRAGLAGRRDVVEVLHMTGAEDGFIARLFQVRFARVAGPGRPDRRRGGRRPGRGACGWPAAARA